MTSPYALPAAPARADTLGTLRAERWHAADAREWARVRELDELITRISARSTPTDPRRETTAAATPRRERRRAR